MSVAFRDMEMPTNCCRCPCAHALSYTDSNTLLCFAVKGGRVVADHLTKQDMYGMTDKVQKPNWCPAFEFKKWEEI